MREYRHLMLHSSKKDAGFSLPIAIGMGLVTLLLGLTLMLRSQDDQVNALNQTQSSQSVSAAESGVNRVRAFLNRYRHLAVYPYTGGTSWSSPGGIDDLTESCNAGNVANDLADLLPDNGDWPDVDPNDVTRGEFRLLDYTFTPDTSGNADAPLGIGTLTVQGRQNGGEALSQVQVEFPVHPVREQTPGLWVRGTITGNSAIFSDILAPCSANPSVDPQGGYALLKTDLAMPTTIPAQTGTVNPLTSIVGKTLPEVGDRDENGTVYDGTNGEIFKYSVSAINGEFSISEGKKVEIWVTGDISLNSRTAINYCGTDPDCGPFDVKIYGTGGTGTISLDTATTLCDMFIFAPNYNVNVIDSAAGAVGTGCGGAPLNTSVFWVNNWDDMTTANPTKPVVLDSPRANWLASPVQPPPQLAPVSNWEKQQAQP